MKSLLYHAFGVKGFRCLRTRYEGGETIFEVEPEKEPEVASAARISVAHDAQRVHRAQAGGAQGEGAGG